MFTKDHVQVLPAPAFIQAEIDQLLMKRKGHSDVYFLRAQNGGVARYFLAETVDFTRNNDNIDPYVEAAIALGVLANKNIRVAEADEWGEYLTVPHDDHTDIKGVGFLAGSADLGDVLNGLVNFLNNRPMGVGWTEKGH